MKTRHRIDYVDDAAGVGSRLRAAREAAGLSQRALSFPGCTAAYISRIENGDRIPSLQLLRELAARLGVDEAHLARGRAGDRPTPGRPALTRVAIRLGELDAARRIAQSTLDEARSSRERATALALLAEVDLALNDLASARTAFTEALALDAELEGRDPEAAEALGCLYLQAGELESAIAVFRRNLERAAAAKDPLEQARFAGLLAGALIDTTGVESAEAVLDRLFAVDESAGDPLTLARHYWAAAQREDSPGAERSLAQAAAVLEAADRQFHTARALQLRAHLELNRGNGSRAAALLEQAAPMARASGHPGGLAAFRVEQARALLAQGHPEAARAAAVEAAASLAEQATAEAGRSPIVLADLFVALGDDERARELYELALARLGDKHDRYATQAYANLAALHERNGDQAAAIRTLKRGLKRPSPREQQRAAL